MPICFRGRRRCLNPGLHLACPAEKAHSYLRSSRLRRAGFTNCATTRQCETTTSRLQTIPRRVTQTITTPSEALIKALDYSPQWRSQDGVRISEHKAFEEWVSKRRRWRRLMGLHASIAAGVKPKIITLPDGRLLEVYWSKRGKVNFLASGSKRRLDDLSRRMQEGDALALQLSPNAVRWSHQDQTAVRENLSESDRLRALRIRQWVDDLEARLLELREAASTLPSRTPLGGLAGVWFRQNPDSKMPVRPKMISLATWSRNTVEKGVSSMPSTPRTNDELPRDVKRRSKHRPPPKLDKYASSWVTRFEQMSQGGGLNLYVLDEPSLGPIVQTYASTTKPLRELRQAWTNTGTLPNYPIIQMWEEIMLWCLHNSPYRALRLLIATLGSTSLRPNRYVANDCLAYLTRQLLQKTQDPDPEVLSALLYATRRFLSMSSDASARAQVIDDSVIYLLLRHCNDQQSQSLLSVCKENNVSLHANTLMHFLDRSLKWGTISHSIEILQSIASSGIDMSSDQIQSACVKLIRTRIGNDNEYRLQTKIVTQLLEMGIVPKIAMCNAIILNAVEAGDFSAAWQMYDVAKANNLAPDSVTYGVLLKGANANGKFDVIERVIQEVLGDQPAMQDLQLLHDVLATISSQTSQSPEKRRSGFRQMLALYKKHCSLAPLRDLRICGPELESPTGSPVKLQWPTPWILAQMVASYVYMRRGQYDLITTYNRYHSLVAEGHPSISQLTHTDFTANAFIKAFGAGSRTLNYCPTVIKHMLEHPKSKTSLQENVPAVCDGSRDTNVMFAESLSGTTHDPASDGGAKGRLQHSPPTVRTWSILAAAYLRHGQKMAAKQVITTMEDRGLRLDKVAWNTLVSGYAGMQDVNAAVDAVGRMQAAGYETDSRTLMGLDKLWDRGRLLNALRKVTQPAKMEFEGRRYIRKKSVEVASGELEADRMKQAHAERYLAGVPSPLCGTDVSDEVEMMGSVS